MFRTVMRVTMLSPSRRVTGVVYSTSASPFTGGVNFLPPRTGSSLGAWAPTPTTNAAASVVAARAMRARFITILPKANAANLERKTATDYTATILHFSVPVLRLRVDRPEDLHVPLTAAPRLDHLGRNHI